jgi:hypothetical protein
VKHSSHSPASDSRVRTVSQPASSKRPQKASTLPKLDEQGPSVLTQSQLNDFLSAIPMEEWDTIKKIVSQDAEVQTVHQSSSVLRSQVAY